MFRFFHSLFGRDDGVEAVPLLPEEDPVLSVSPGRVLDIAGLIHQASLRVSIGRLRRLGKKAVSLLSRRKIDELVTLAIQRFLDRAARAPSASGLSAQASKEIRKDFDGLLSQYLVSALDGDPETGGPAFEVVDGRPRTDLSFDQLKLAPGRGLHVETLSIACAGRAQATGETVVAAQQNAFLQVLADDSTKKILRQLQLGFVTHGDSGYIVGDPAIELGRVFGKTPRRPMQQGTLSPGEPVGLFILSLLLRQVVGLPGKPGEICVYSVPADPIEADRNFIYHLGALESALKALGYTPRPMTECHLLASSELKDQDYTGIGASFGAGMVNVGISYKGIPVLGLSKIEGSDWIDSRVGEAVGVPPEEIRAIRQGGMNLEEPKGRTEGAIAIYTRTLLQSTIEALKRKLSEAQALPNFGRPIPVVCAGESAAVPGFLEVFKDEIEKARIPIRIDYLRLARNPVTVVAEGCLEAALEETRVQAEGLNETAPSVLARAPVSGVPKKGLPSLAQFRKSAAG